jgi:hypothetical protein
LIHLETSFFRGVDGRSGRRLVDNGDYGFFVSFRGPFGFDMGRQFDVQSTRQFVVMSFLLGGFGVDIVGLRSEDSLPNGFVMELSSCGGFDGPLSVDGGDARGVEMQSFGFGALEAKLEGRCGQIGASGSGGRGG